MVWTKAEVVTTIACQSRGGQSLTRRFLPPKKRVTPRRSCPCRTTASAPSSWSSSPPRRGGSRRTEPAGGGATGTGEVRLIKSKKRLDSRRWEFEKCEVSRRRMFRTWKVPESKGRRVTIGIAWKKKTYWNTLQVTFDLTVFSTC